MVYALTKIILLCLLLTILPLTQIGLVKSYLMTPIIDKKKSSQLQWQNIKAIILEKRNHPGLIAI